MKNQTQNNNLLRSFYNQDEQPWQVLIIDDNLDFCQQIGQKIQNLKVINRPIDIQCFSSQEQAINTLINPSKTALVLLKILDFSTNKIDICEHFRHHLHNQATRFLIYTEKNNYYLDTELIINYDITNIIPEQELINKPLILTVGTAINNYFHVKKKADYQQGIQQLKAKIKSLQASQETQDSRGRKFPENKRQKFSAKLQAFFNAFPDLFFLIDPNGTILDYHTSDLNQLYLNPGSFVNRPMREIFSPELSNRLIATITKARETGIIQTVEYSLPFAEGEEYFDARIVPIEADQLVVVVRNISENIIIKKQLQEAYNKLELRVQERTKELQHTNQLLRQEIAERQKTELALRQISLGIQCFNSEVFFQSLVQNLTKTLNVEYAIIGEFIENNRVKTIAFSAQGEIVDNMEYDLINTPCCQVKNKELCIYSGNVQAKFPLDEFFPDLGIVSYMGTPLYSIEGEVLGIICILSHHLFEDIHLMQEIIQIFAVRAGAELERRQAEQKLLDTEEKFRQLADNINQVFYIHKTQYPYQYIYVSPAFEEILGISRDKLYQDSFLWLNLVHPQDYERVKISFDNALTEGGFNEEYRIIRANGEIRWICDHNFPIKDSSGQIYRVAGIVEDITERKEQQEAIRNLNQNLEHLVEERTTQLRLEIAEHKKTEAALRSSEERWQLAIHGTNDGIWDWNLETNQVFRSQRLKEMLGYEDEDFNNDLEDWKTRVHPDDYEQVIEALQLHFQGQTDYYQSEYRIRCKNNSYKWILDRGKAIWDDTGKPIRMVGSYSDITERKQMEETIRRNEERMRQITSLSPGMIFQFGVTPENEYFLSFASDAATTIYELTPEQITENVEHLFALVKPEEISSVREAIEYSRQHLSDFNVDCQITTPSGQKKWIRATSKPQRKKDGTVIWNGVSLDITLEKQQQEELQIAKEAADAANQAKSQFLANISHEIRTPMNAIIGFCDLLKGVVTEKRPRFYVSAISTAGKTLLDLINDILDLSKIEAGKLEINIERVNINLLIQEICQIFSEKAQQKQLHLVTEIAPDLPQAILFDQIRLRQILFNVVGNALKFTEKGYVKIIVKHQISKVQENNQLIYKPDFIDLEIVVEDTGIGIKTEQQAQIFEAFVQSEGQTNRQYEGTGLGLAITKRLTEMLRGEIRLISEVGKGSTFTFIFPQVALSNLPTISETFSAKDQDLNQFQPSTILIVDDVTSNRELLEDYFEDTHHKIVLASDGLETLHKVQQNNPNLILLDLRMPKMDGWETAIHLKKNETTKNIPIVIVTASLLKQEEAELREMGLEFVRKPVSRTELVSVLKNILPPSDNISPVQSQGFRETTSTVSASSPAISPEIQAKLPQLFEILEQEKPNWEKLSQTMIRRDLKKFAQLLIDLSADYQYKPLSDYAHSLMTQIEQFEIDKLPQTMAKFPDLIANPVK